MAQFVPGVGLCAVFYAQAVRPLVEEALPGLRYAAARVGAGSEVLGYDTEQSVDHDWGPRLELFLTATDAVRYQERLSLLLADRLPKQILGWPTHFEPPHERVRVMAHTDGAVAHRVLITDVGSWATPLLGNSSDERPTTLSWLSIPTQTLAEVTGGSVYHDSVGELTALRRQLSWYPDDVWRYVLASQWTRIGQEEAVTGRTAQAGDDLGSRIVAARLAREVMRLCLLLARRYPPYSKWLGTAFGRLPQATGIAQALRAALSADDADARQDALCTAYEATGRWQNTLGLAEPVDPTRRPYHDRPFPVIGAQRFAEAMRAHIGDPWLAGLAPVGAVDQFIDSTDTLTQAALARAATRAVHASGPHTNGR
ncbi:DUF4037 domain-containing protein [Catellatospora methionotrophica]|uniref:DUF4037 domain-containing protein n=1 Tax=Catellatospora methionotrophica TaxID=121620 RepID=UPI0033F42A91